METVLIGFGSNQGDPLAICKAAIESLKNHPAVEVERVSSFYRTAPVGFLDQDWFVNGVVLGRTTLTPPELMDVLQAVEHTFGRTRSIRWGPRTLDLDLLAYGDQVLNHPDLTVPHTRMHERRFVLAPLVEIYPDWIHPVLKRSAKDLLAALPEDDGQDVQPMVSP